MYFNVEIYWLMEILLGIKINEKLYLRNPEDTVLGRKILKHSVELIYKLGFESFTFKKLAEKIGSTESGIYRYFENKHRLLIYITSWYFGWLAYKISFQTNNLKNPKIKLQKIIKLMALPIKDDKQTSYIDEGLLHSVIVAEGSKAYLTKQVDKDNKLQFFKPYKDLCNLIGDIILEYNPKYKYPKSLASTIVEVVHFQNFFMHNLSSLTDYSKNNNKVEIVGFLNNLVFSSLDKK